MSATFERVDRHDVPWAELDAMGDRTVMQTREWLEFLAETQGVEPIVAHIADGPATAGWFTGAIVRRMGLKVLGSPVRGWTTAAMGFNLVEGADRPRLLAELPRFAFRGLGCVHLEFADRALLDDGDVPEGFALSHLRGYELDVAGDDDELLARMKSYGRRDVRRSIRNGIEVQRVDPVHPGSFAGEYYDQVSEAFAKRGQVPTYPMSRIESMIRHLGPTGRVLLLRARTPAGELAATGIFPGMPGGTAEYWMGGSYQRHQSLLPNEALMWTAIRTWRDLGAVRFNFGGGGTYKAKYGGEAHVMPWVRKSRFEAIEKARQLAFDRHRKAKRSGKATAAR